MGIEIAKVGLFPEEKLEAIKKFNEQESRITMVGDGVNDAPAMVHSTETIAIGGSDVALETADIVIMADKLETLPIAIGLSRKAMAIIK